MDEKKAWFKTRQFWTAMASIAAAVAMGLTLVTDLTAEQKAQIINALSNAFMSPL